MGPGCEVRGDPVEDDGRDNEDQYKVQDAGSEDNECRAEAGLFGGLGGGCEGRGGGEEEEKEQ